MSLNGGSTFRPEFQDTLLGTDSWSTDLKSHTVHGALIMVFSQSIKFITTLASTAILARLLTPYDFGLIAMVTAVTGFLAMLKDMGLPMATVQRAKISHDEISLLFWMNVALSVVVFLIASAFGPIVSWFYHEPKLTWIVLFISLNFIFSGLAAQHRAILNRKMRFKALAVVDVVSLIVGGIAGIYCAWLGIGYWALVVMQLSIGVTSMMLTWVICSWIPGRLKRVTPVRSLVSFGAHLTGFNLVNYFARNLDDVLIGSYWGSSQLGLYSKAYSLLILPIQQINNPIAAVTIPALSRLQDNCRRYRDLYLKALTVIVVFTVPACLFMALMSDEIIYVFLGPQWSEAGRIFRILAIGGVVQPVLNTSGWLYVSSGRTVRMFQWGVFSSSLIVLSFFVGVPFGLRGVATSYTVAILILVWPCLHFVTKGTSISTKDILHAIQSPFAAAMLAIGSCWIVKIRLDPLLTRGTILLICVALMGGVYYLVLFHLFGMKSFYHSILKELGRVSIAKT